MVKHPLHNIAIVGAYNTKQARSLAADGWVSETLLLDAVRGVLNDAGLKAADIDRVTATANPWTASHLIYQLGIGPSWAGHQLGIMGVLDAAAAINAGFCHTALIAGGQAGRYVERESTAPWTRPSNEFVESWGLFTTAEFALMARRHMHTYGTKPEQMATVAAAIRNNGHRNPEAVYYGRGPFTPADILASRMIADPYHLLDCCMTSEGGGAVIVTTAERARDMKKKPVYILGGGIERWGPGYHHPPSFDYNRGRGALGWAGRSAAERGFGMAGLQPKDVDTCEFYDNFSFELIRQFEAFGFCGEGEGGDFVMGGTVELDGKYPLCTDGGLMSYSHCSSLTQALQRVIRGAQQLRGECGALQVKDAKVSMISNYGGGALLMDAMLLGNFQP